MYVRFKGIKIVGIRKVENKNGERKNRFTEKLYDTEVKFVVELE